MATGSGVAIIVGAGIYVLLGEAAAAAGSAVWLSFLLAGTAAFFTALSYAELAAMHPKAAAGYNYAKEAFGAHAAFVVGWLTLFSQVVSIAAVALGFAAYIHESTGAPVLISGLGLAAAAGLLSFHGVRESTSAGALLSTVEIVGLLIVVSLGLSYVGAVDLLDSPRGALGVLGGASLVFFAFVGFEQVANLAEEVRRPGRDLPVAILVSGGVAAALYVIVAITAVSILGWRELAVAEAPLAAVAKAAWGNGGARLLSALGVIATASTVVIAMVAAARSLYGMALGGSVHRHFGRVHARRKTPWVATLAVTLVVAAAVLIQDIGFVAQMTNFTILLVFIGVNLSLIALRKKHPRRHRPFRVPFSVRGVPVNAVLGIATALLLLTQVGLLQALSSLAVTAGAWLVYALQNRRKAVS